MHAYGFNQKKIGYKKRAEIFGSTVKTVYHEGIFFFKEGLSYFFFIFVLSFSVLYTIGFCSKSWKLETEQNLLSPTENTAPETPHQ